MNSIVKPELNTHLQLRVVQRKQNNLHLDELEPFVNASKSLYVMQIKRAGSLQQNRPGVAFAVVTFPRRRTLPGQYSSER
jgi:hypothetical protein